MTNFAKSAAIAGTALAVVCAASLLVSSADAQQKGPFAGLEGPWVGSGRITMQNGSNERIRCRAKYSVSPSGANLHQDLRCASDSYKFEVVSNVVSDSAGAIAGTWTETTRNVTGQVAGTAAGGNIRTQVQGPSFTAALEVRVQGNHQSVSIVPQGVDVRQVVVTLARG